MLLFYPLQGVLTITLVLAAFLLAEGLFKIALSLRLRATASWGWLLFSGVLSLILGGLIFIQWPGSAFWVLGLLIGIDLLFARWGLVMLAFAARRHQQYYGRAAAA